MGFMSGIKAQLGLGFDYIWSMTYYSNLSYLVEWVEDLVFLRIQ
jgi:hypothetical protein